MGTLAQLTQGDCLELMKGLPDKSVNLILCDLPFGTSACKWDSVLDLDKMWAQYERIITDKGAIVLFGSEPFSSKLRLSNIKLYKYDWKWDKGKGANFLNFQYQPAKSYEDILVFSKGASSYSPKGTMTYNPQMTKGTPYVSKNGNKGGLTSTIRSSLKSEAKQNTGERYPLAIQKFSLDTVKLHPTQKPVALLEYLIKTYTLEGETVLDNCMGSGSTGVACINTNRNFIGIELDENYYSIAKKRIESI